MQYALVRWGIIRKSVTTDKHAHLKKLTSGLAGPLSSVHKQHHRLFGRYLRPLRSTPWPWIREMESEKDHNPRKDDRRMCLIYELRVYRDLFPFSFLLPKPK